MIFDKLVKNFKNRLEEKFDGKPRADNASFKLSNVIMCGFALFSLKDSSLLKFVNRFKNRKSNLYTIYKITQSPSDSTMRALLDNIETSELKDEFKPNILALDNQGVLDNYKYLNNYLYIPIDGTQYFKSKTIHCDNCLEMKHKNGEITYTHKGVCACIVKPETSVVFPIAIEDVSKQDGNTKNDCETNATKRLIPQLVNTLPIDSDILIGGDALYCTGPMINLIKIENEKREGEIDFIFNIKPGSHGYLFSQFNSLEGDKIKIYTHETKDTKYVTKFCNGLILNKSNEDILVNMLYFEEHNLKTGKVKIFSWATSITIVSRNYKKLVKIGRSRWKIENETFNTLKNQGYQFEHNFGHGHNNLAANFGVLMLLAFLFDQIQLATNKFFRMAKGKERTYKDLWEKIRHWFDEIKVDSMQTIYKIIAKILKIKVELIN